MKIELHEIPIQDVVKYSKHLKKCQGYIDKEEEGVYGMSGRQTYARILIRRKTKEYQND